MEDTHNVQRLKEGSYDDFTILYHRYFPKLYGFIFGLIRSHTTSKEIVQETFIKVWEKRADLNPDLSFQSFLFMIARNKLLNEIRNQTGNKQFIDYIEFADTASLSENATETKIDYDDFVKNLRAAKSKLSPRQLEIFRLSKEDGFSIHEISEKLSITEQSVSNQLSIALRILKENLNKIAVFNFYIMLLNMFNNINL
ncbi:MAG: RNA polymerase sigma-70 factor [Bacteroidales bacterium]|nr:RNA polymerase sigma-70 factor [Bacteroidales bacterium]